MIWLQPLTVGVAAALVSSLAVRPLLAILRRRQIVDTPNQRSSHIRPTPRGGGIAVIGAVLACWLVALAGSGGLDRTTLAIAGLTAALAAVSFVDDLGGLPVAARLALQIVAVAIALGMLDANVLVFQGLVPAVVDRVAAAIVWLWFINLFNFMDGIDGIAGVETACLGAGIVAVALLLALGPTIMLPAAAVAGAAIGFLPWNWQPARIFLGDVGSVALGFLLGWLLLELAAAGAWAAALLLPLYFLADATITLLRRLLRGEAVWRAHRSHFYQHAARALDSHARVTLLVLAGNLVLIACAVATVTTASGAWWGLGIGSAAMLLLLWYFRSRKDERTP